MSSPYAELGHIVRLEPFPVSLLPYHPMICDGTSTIDFAVKDAQVPATNATSSARVLSYEVESQNTDIDVVAPEACSVGVVLSHPGPSAEDMAQKPATEAAAPDIATPSKNLTAHDVMSKDAPLSSNPPELASAVPISSKDVSSSEGNSKDSTSIHESTKETSLNNDVPEDADTDETSPKDSSSKDATTIDPSTKEHPITELPTEEVSTTELSKDVTSSNVLIKDASPNDVSATKGPITESLKEATANNTSPQEVTSTESAKEATADAAIEKRRASVEKFLATDPAINVSGGSSAEVLSSTTNQAEAGPSNAVESPENRPATQAPRSSNVGVMDEDVILPAPLRVQTPPSERPGLLKFIHEAVHQAELFIAELGPVVRSPRNYGDDVDDPPVPNVAEPLRWIPKGIKKYYNTPVRLFKRQVTQQQLVNVPWNNALVARPDPVFKSRGGSYRSETWFGRFSQHSDRVQTGTASFTEFDDGLKKDHSRNEQRYTPECTVAHQVLEWKIPETARAGPYRGLTMSIQEMVHKLPRPFRPRVFPVLVITARLRDSAFIVVQVPLSGVETLPGSIFTKKSGYVTAVYSSVECVQSHERGALIDWAMATASDAKGYLPAWLQATAVPGAIAKDVKHFFKWLVGVRQERDQTPEYDPTDPFSQKSTVLIPPR
ncbi:MAG: hypothetical protein M1825_004724 [Sarcosagium campestre]|nr:MAG: hypothetical protein M1825_004724 [Sarcosagium campestre]